MAEQTKGLLILWFNKVHRVRPREQENFVHEGHFNEWPLGTGTRASRERNTEIVNRLGYDYRSMLRNFRSNICQGMHRIAVLKKDNQMKAAEEVAKYLIDDMQRRN